MSALVAFPTRSAGPDQICSPDDAATNGTLSPPLIARVTARPCLSTAGSCPTPGCGTRQHTAASKCCRIGRQTIVCAGLGNPSFGKLIRGPAGAGAHSCDPHFIGRRRFSVRHVTGLTNVQWLLVDQFQKTLVDSCWLVRWHIPMAGQGQDT